MLPSQSGPAAPPDWRRGAVELLRAFRWERAIAPLLRFCREPWRDATRERFVQPLATTAPADAAGFRLRRRLRLAWAALAPRAAGGRR
jgi:hypothetical protein